MEKQVVSQTDFSGGMDSNKDAENLAENQYADAKNVEIRDDNVRTRRGSILLYDWGDSYALQGAGIYQAVFGDQRKETLLFVRNGTCYRMNVPQGAVAMTTPSGITITTDETIRFVQAYNYIYMIRGEDKPVLRWSGYNSDNWEELPAPTAGDPFPNCTFGIYEYNRGWVVTGQDTLNASDLLSEEFDYNFQSYDIDSGDGGKITGLLAYMDGGILVFKEGSVHILTGCNGDLSNLARQVVDSRHGCVAPDSVVMVGSDVWFLSRDGVRSIQLTQYNKAQMLDTTVSEKIPTLINRINWAYAQNAQSVVYDNYVLVAVPFDSSTVNDTILVYDLKLKVWVGYWQGVTAQRLLLGKQDNLDILYSLDSVGDTRILLRDFYQDNSSHVVACAHMTVASATGINLSSIVSGSTLSGYSNGMISFDICVLDARAGWLLKIYGTNTDLEITTDSLHVHFYLSTAAGARWAFNIPITTLSLSLQKLNRYVLKHDGTEPELWIDGVKQTVTFTTSTDKTKWLPDLVSGTMYMYIGRGAGANPPECYFKNFSIYKDVASVRTYLCNLLFNEGSGTTVKDMVSLTSFTISSPNPSFWLAPASPASISYLFTSRGYNFGASQVNKSLKMGQVCVRHRQPNFTITLTDDKEYESQTLLSGKTYSLTKYDIHGVADWANTGIDFATPKRQDYAPLYLPAAGMSLESLANASYNVKPDIEQEHTEMLFSGRVCSMFQLEIENTTGSLALKEISMQASPNVFGRKAQE